MDPNFDLGPFDEPKPPDTITVAELVELYLQLDTTEFAVDTKIDAVSILTRFAADFGPRLAASLKGIDWQQWAAAHPQWKSWWSLTRILARVKRMLNWACEMGLLTVNPLLRVRNRAGVKKRRTPMKDDDYQTILRHSDPSFRRILTFLRFSGCRPKEASTMRWKDVHFDKKAVILSNHKTARKTGRPRVIPLVPTVIKLLVWMRTHRQVSVVGLVERFLLANGGRLKIGDLARQLEPYGCSPHAVRRAGIALALVRKWLGGYHPKGGWWYILPADHERLPDPREHDLIFATSLGTAWNRHSLDRKLKRICQRAGLATMGRVMLYQLRHRFGTVGVANSGGNVKMVGLAMGHRRSSTTEIYVDESRLDDGVYQAALQAAYGPGARSADAPPPPPPRPIVMLEPQAVAEIQGVCESIPDRYGNTRPRPHVPIARPLEPIPVDAHVLNTVLNGILHKLGKPEPPKRGRPSGIPRKLNPAHEQNWKAYHWALERNADLQKATDADVFQWLTTQPDCPAKLPPRVGTFVRYVRLCRLFYDCRKRILRPREPLPEPLEEEESA